MASESLKSEPVIDSRVAQLEAALAEIAQQRDALAFAYERKGDYQSGYEEASQERDAALEQVATLHQEQARLTRERTAIEWERDANYSNLQETLRILTDVRDEKATATRERDEALQEIASLRDKISGARQC